MKRKRRRGKEEQEKKITRTDEGVEKTVDKDIKGIRQVEKN